MASIKLAAGTLSPPACYEDEQQRFEAYVAKIVATILGGVQWEFQESAPVDLGLYWLRRNSDGRPRGPRKYTTDARWVPWLEIPVWCDTSGGVANAYTATSGHSLTAALVNLTGRRVLFIASATNTGASTLDVDGTGAVAIVRHSGDALLAGDLVTDGIYEVIYNAAGPRWELTTPVPPSEVVLPELVTLTGAVPGVGSSTVLAHTKAVIPKFVEVRFVCTAVDRSYQINDEVKAESVFWTTSGYSQPLFAIGIDATNITLSRGSNVASATVRLGVKGGAADSIAVAMDLTKWTVKVNCYFI